MNINQIPRFRGKLAQYVEPKEVKDKWCFMISVWSFDGEHKIGDDFGPLGAFETESEAGEALKKACRIMCDEFTKMHGLPPSDTFIDMKNGAIVRPWESQ